MTNTKKWHFLCDVGKALNKHNVRWWLNMGALLGIVRDGNFIEWDHDIDLSMFKSEMPKVLSAKKELAKIGEFGETREKLPDGREIIVEHYVIIWEGDKPFKIDLFYHWPSKVYPGSYIRPIFPCGELPSMFRVPAFYYDNLEIKAVQRTTLSLCFNVPCNLPNFLRLNYGPGCMKPDKNWDWRMQPNCEYLDFKPEEFDYEN